MQLYAIVLNELCTPGHETNNVENFLGQQNRPTLYKLNDAMVKAGEVGGVPEKYGNQHTFDKYPSMFREEGLNVIQLVRGEIPFQILNEMMVDEYRRSDAQPPESLFFTHIFDTVLENQMLLGKRKRMSMELLDELYVLDNVVRGYEYVSIVSI